MARLAMTSLAFIFVWVPLPVCHTTSGKCSSSRPSITSSAAWTIASALSGAEQAEVAGRRGRAAFLMSPRARIISPGKALAPILK